MATAKTPKAAPAAKAAASKKPAALPAAAGAGAAAVQATEIEAVAVDPTPAVKPVIESAAQVVADKPAPVETAVADSIEAAPEPVEDIVPPALPATLIEFPVLAPVMTHIVEPALNGVDELLDFSKANAEAMIAASHSLAIGLQSLAHDLIEWSHHSLESSVATGKALAEAGSVQNALELTQSAAQQSLEKILDEGSRLGSRSTKLVEESFARLRARVEAVVEKLTSHAA